MVEKPGSQAKVKKPGSQIVLTRSKIWKPRRQQTKKDCPEAKKPKEDSKAARKAQKPRSQKPKAKKQKHAKKTYERMIPFAGQVPGQTPHITVLIANKTSKGPQSDLLA